MANKKNKDDDFILEYRRKIFEEVQLVTIKKAADILSCSPETVIDLIYDGKIHLYCQFGPTTKGRRVLLSELREFIKSKRIDVDP